MKKLLGSLYLLTLSYKRDVIIFWFINTLMVTVLLLAASIFRENMLLVLTASVPAYVFVTILSTKLLNKTLPSFLKLGVNRLQYTMFIGLFLLCFTLIQALIITLLQQIAIGIAKLLSFGSILLIHPVMLFDMNSNPNILMTIFVDIFFMLFLCLMGLLISLAFYRFGTIGGYSLLGFIVIIPLLSLILNWHVAIIKALTEVDIMTFTAVISVIIVLLFAIFAAGLRKISIIAAN